MWSIFRINDELYDVPLEVEDLEESDDSASIEGDDCPAVNEDAPGYTETEPELANIPELENDGVSINVENFEDEYWFSNLGDTGVEDGGENADDDGDSSGDDIWNDDIIPDPLTDDDEEELEGRLMSSRPHEMLALGKCFNNSDEFKLALLNYSLKTEYNIKMCKSSSDRLGAKCTHHIEEKCPWRVYCSFEKSKNKLMVKVYINEHVCTRNSYTKMLKSGSIALLYEERLRLNPKIRPEEMVPEIKREYNMIVTLGQCRRARSNLIAKRKATHQS